ncbi:MAG TPA: enoyl-CoA hydratase [Acidimicrobiales bacterium]|jgi:enoyl-CoA hydratase
MSTTPVILSDFAEGVATITLNRPEARNALNSELLAAMPQALIAADGDERVRAIVLTGADPAFCAGLDLKELGSTGANLGAGEWPAGGAGAGAGAERTTRAPWPVITKPVIGAINGPAVTGGLEVALQCDFLVASERARFADTHARVGVVPGWGLTVLLPQAIGLRRAKEMSLTGNFVDAAEAHALGLVGHVVPHHELLPTAVRLARDIASNDPDGVAALLASYKETALTTAAEGLLIERRVSETWRGDHFDPAEVERRRAGVLARARSQTS